MADAPRDLVHQLRGVDGAFSQLSGGRALEERILDAAERPARARRTPVVVGALSACALAAAVLLWTGRGADEVAHATPATQGGLQDGPQDAPRDAPSIAPGGAAPEGERSGGAPDALAVAPPAPTAPAEHAASVGAPHDAAAPRAREDVPLPETLAAPDVDAPLPAPRERIAMPQAPAPRRAPRDVAPERTPRALHRAAPEKLSTVAALTDAEVPGALRRLKELRAAGAHRELVALAEQLLARSLPARERETVSYERARSLTRLEDAGACRALDAHVRAFPASAEDTAALRARARCP